MSGWQGIAGDRSCPTTGELPPRQPLRYLLADDPGAGKTFMAGLLIIGDAQKQMLRS
jgi:hypothetical protein